MRTDAAAARPRVPTGGTYKPKHAEPRAGSLRAFALPSLVQGKCQEHRPPVAMASRVPRFPTP